MKRLRKQIQKLSEGLSQSFLGKINVYYMIHIIKVSLISLQLSIFIRKLSCDKANPLIERIIFLQKYRNSVFYSLFEYLLWFLYNY